MISKIALIFIVVTSLEFLNLKVLEEFNKTAQLISVILLIVYTLRYYILKKKETLHGFNYPIVLLFLSFLLSSIAAEILYEQDIITTLIAQRFMYFYLIYYLLYDLKIETSFLKKIIVLIGVGFSFLYLYLYFSLDSSIISLPIMVERGTVRIGLPGILYLQVSLFILLEKFLKDRNINLLLLIILLLSVVILTGTRGIVLPTIAILLLFLLNNTKYNYLLNNGIVILMIGVSLYFFYDIINGIVNLTIQDIYAGSGNYGVRISALVIFFSMLFKHPLTYITGNGLASEISKYGQDIYYLKKTYSAYQSDIGIIGDYIRFGLLYLIAIGMIVMRVIKRGTGYIKYSFIFIIVTMILLSHFGTFSHIPLICILLYLFENQSNDNREEK